MKLTLILLSLVLILSSSTCGKKRQLTCAKEIIINYEGPLAGDGCEWVVTSDGQRFHPLSLDDNMKQNGMHAHAAYKLTGDTFYCGIMPMKLPVIEFTCFQYLQE